MPNMHIRIYAYTWPVGGLQARESEPRVHHAESRWGRHVQWPCRQSPSVLKMATLFSLVMSAQACHSPMEISPKAFDCLTCERTARGGGFGRGGQGDQRSQNWPTILASPPRVHNITSALLIVPQTSRPSSSPRICPARSLPPRQPTIGVGTCVLSTASMS